MSITYKFTTPVYPADILYVNIIPLYSCTNDCVFCSRPRHGQKKNIYEEKAGTSLWLPTLPTIDEIVNAIEIDIKPTDTEIAFIGLGEPLQFLPTVIEVLRYIKDKYHIKTRIDTNGLVTDRYPHATQQLSPYVDEIRISLNATTSEDYNALCRPKTKNAFKHVVSFVQQCKAVGIETYVSFVVDFKLSKTREEYKEFAQSLGIQEDHVICREYVKPIKE